MATRTELEAEVESLRAENALLVVELEGFRKKKQALLAKVEEMISTLEREKEELPGIEELRKTIQEREKAVTESRKGGTPF
jgi:predicted RNase H-like nuclease (RuvC/YqgF family)